MTTEVGRIHVVDVEAGAQVPPEGHLLYARDTDDMFKSDGTTLTALAGGGSYTNEEAQDAVGSMVDATLTYVDATPSLGVATNGIGNTHIRDSAALSVIGRSANSSGDPADIAGATVGHVLQVLSGPTIGFGANGVRRPSWDNPPASPHAMDDEFDSGSLDGKWTLSSSATTNAATTGTIDYTASLTTPIIDVATVPSMLMFQSDNSSVGYVNVYQAYSASTDATFFVRMGFSTRDTNTNGEGNLSIVLSNTGDANEWVSFGLSHNASTGTAYLQVNNNGAITTVFGTGIADTALSPSVYLVMWKKSDVYYVGHAADQKGMFSLISNGATVTKTGVTTLDRLTIEFRTANETPSIIEGVDFFRYKASLDYSLVNP